MNIQLLEVLDLSHSKNEIEPSWIYTVYLGCMNSKDYYLHLTYSPSKRLDPAYDLLYPCPALHKGVILGIRLATWQDVTTEVHFADKN
jgi:hypothetical protein